MLSIVGVLAGFAVTTFFSGKETGVRGRMSWKVRVRDYSIHLHHWVCGLLILAITYRFFQGHLWYHQDLQIVCYSFLIGLILQGLTYTDFYRVFYRSDDTNEDSYF